MRVLICSETTPTARKAAHARPAPRPNRLVNVEAIQSVVSPLVAELPAGLAGFCCCTLTEAGSCGCSDELLLSCGDGFGCEGGIGGVGGGGVCDDEEKLVLVNGWERNGGDPKKVAIF
jgi:hypothetical protein